jgi:hypothetical protein
MARVTPDDPAPHIDEAILLGVVDKHLLVREFPLRHPPSAALLVVSLPGKRGSCVLRPNDPLRPFTPPRTVITAPGTKLNFALHLPAIPQSVVAKGSILA